MHDLLLSYCMVVIFDMFIVTALSNAGVRKSQRVRVIIVLVFRNG